jgi:hypothetical protein
MCADRLSALACIAVRTNRLRRPDLSRALLKTRDLMWGQSGSDLAEVFPPGVFVESWHSISKLMLPVQPKQSIGVEILMCGRLAVMFLCLVWKAAAAVSIFHTSRSELSLNSCQLPRILTSRPISPFPSQVVSCSVPVLTPSF